MGVYLGGEGQIQVTRTASSSAMFTTLAASDVDTVRNRFSVDGAYLQLITGDRVQFKTQDGTDLQFAQTMGGDSDVIRFVHVDEIGGLRLYDTFSKAVTGGKSQAEVLDAPSDSQAITVKVLGEPDEDRCLAQVQSFTLTTSRDNIDLTCLSQQYRNNYENGLIQGQGQLTCFWAYDQLCQNGEIGDVEFGEYLARLCIRVVQGAGSHGRFFLHYAETTNQSSTWYECETCLISNVAVQVEPSQLITAEIDFVTSGPIVLRHGQPPEFLLQKTGGVEGMFELEQNTSSFLELENNDG
jgi:hypothetical protein